MSREEDEVGSGSWVQVHLGGVILIIATVFMLHGFSVELLRRVDLERNGVRTTVQVVGRWEQRGSCYRSKERCSSYGLLVRTAPPWSPSRARFRDAPQADRWRPPAANEMALYVPHGYYDSAWVGQPLAVVQAPGDLADVELAEDFDRWRFPWLIALLVAVLTSLSAWYLAFAWKELTRPRPAPYAPPRAAFRRRPDDPS